MLPSGAFSDFSPIFCIFAVSFLARAYPSQNILPTPNKMVRYRCPRHSPVMSQNAHDLSDIQFSVEIQIKQLPLYPREVSVTFVQEGLLRTFKRRKPAA